MYKDLYVSSKAHYQHIMDFKRYSSILRAETFAKELADLLKKHGAHLSFREDVEISEEEVVVYFEDKVSEEFVISESSGLDSDNILVSKIQHW